jgi:hypothetical protein
MQKLPLDIKEIRKSELQLISSFYLPFRMLTQIHHYFLLPLLSACFLPHLSAYFYVPLSYYTWSSVDPISLISFMPSTQAPTSFSVFLGSFFHINRNPGSRLERTSCPELSLIILSPSDLNSPRSIHPLASPFRHG